MGAPGQIQCLHPRLFLSFSCYPQLEAFISYPSMAVLTPAITTPAVHCNRWKQGRRKLKTCPSPLRFLTPVPPRCRRHSHLVQREPERQTMFWAAMFTLKNYKFYCQKGEGENGYWGTVSSLCRITSIV